MWTRWTGQRRRTCLWLSFSDPWARVSRDSRRTVWSKMKILEAPVLEHISQICMSAHMFHLHSFQQLLRFRIIDTFNLLVIKEVLLFTFMFHDLEASRSEEH